MTFPELIAQPTQSSAEAYLAYAPSPAAETAPQHWTVTVADAKYHWYDLIAGFPEVPDIRDPIGRYMRRMQFDLEAAAEKRLAFCVITRPRVRFDTARQLQWSFFGLKLTLPLLMGSDELKESVTIELKVPFAATMKKPTVSMNENFITLNWGGLVEALSIHDVLQNYVNNLKIPSKVVYVGQTRDPAGLLAKGRLPAVQKLRQQHGEHYDTLLLVQQLHVEVACASGDPAALPANELPAAADAIARDRMDVIEAALIRYFEGAAPRGRNNEEKCMRKARLREVQDGCNLAELTIDLQLPEAGNYRYLSSEFAAAAQRHLLSCDIVDDEMVVARLPTDAKA